MEKQPLVSVVIPNFNGKHHLQECLGSLRETTYPNFEVIVMDNNSTDGSVEFVKSAFPEVKVVELSENKGFSGACNLGARVARGDYVVFLNNDVKVDKEWLSWLLRYVQIENVGACCGKVKMFHNPMWINACGGMCDRFALGWNRGIMEVDRGQYDEVEECFYAVGCCLIVRRDLFRKLGGFDPAYFMYFDDLDFSWRLRLAGFTVLYVPMSVVYHKWMGSSRRRFMDFLYFYNRNRIRTLLKNYHWKSLLRILPLYVFLQVAHIGWILIRRQLSELFPVVKAWLWNLKHLRGTLTMRRRVQKMRKVSDDEIRKNMFNETAGILVALGKIKHPIFGAV